MQCACKDNALLLTRFTASRHSQSWFEATSKSKGDLLDPEGSLSACLPMKAIALANKVVEKAIVDKDLSKKRSQYFIFMVAVDAASCFVLFYAARSLELLE